MADLFIDCEATLFLPILIMGYKTGFFRRLLRKMMGKEGWLAW